MENKRTQTMKRLAMFVIACAVALTTVLVPIPAKAADMSAPLVVKQFILQKGEKWQPAVYNAGDDATVSYKINKKAVAVVNKKGVVTAKKPGKATLTYMIQTGGKTYKAKTVITVKAQMELYEYVKRSNTELAIMYACYYSVLEANGLLDDQDVQETLAACDSVVLTANDIVENPDNYTDDQILEEIDAIHQMAEFILETLSE